MLHKVQGERVKRRFKAAFRSARWRRTSLSGWNLCRRSVTAKRAFKLPLHSARGFEKSRLPKSSRMWTRRPRSKSLESQCIPVDLASMTTKACLYLVALRLQHPPEVATLGREGRKKHEHATRHTQSGGSLTALILRATLLRASMLSVQHVPYFHRHVATCPDAGERRH